MVISLRSANLSTDAAAIARLLTVSKAEQVTPDQVHEWWQPHEGGRRTTEIAIDERGEIIGMSDLNPLAWLDAGLYYLGLIVMPARRGRGVGTRLYASAEATARRLGVTTLRCEVRDNDPGALAFARERGYQTERHTFESSLDLAAFDDGPFLGVIQRLQLEGIRFFAMADAGLTEKEARRKLYALNRATGQDNSGNDGAFPPFEEFSRNVFEASWFRADGQILGADGERWVALGAIALSSSEPVAYNAFTGVDRAYRGRGLATAVKALALQWARENGATLARTDNDSENAPMLAVNRKLGYQPQPGAYRLAKPLT